MKTREDYIQEIGARFSPLLFRLTTTPLKLVLNRMFPEILVDGIENLKSASESGTVVYASNHRSYTDHMLLGLVLDKEGIKSPYYGAGKNMFNPWSSPLMKNLGVFSIDRHNKNPEYLIALKDYIKGLLEKEQDFVFYIEGGRSYNGKLGTPKFLILKAIIESEKENVSIIPTSVNYEQVLEDKVLASMGGKTKQRSFNSEVRELLGMFLNYYPSKGFWHRHYSTTAYINFAKQINISEYREKDGALRLGKEIMSELKLHKAVTATSIASRELLHPAQAKDSGLEDRINEGLNYFLDRGILERKNGDLIISQPKVLDYYANNLL